MALKKTPIVISLFNKEDRTPDGFIKNLLDKESFKLIPEEKGSYIIVSNSQKFILPKGESKVIYIGKSDNLRSRLTTHRKHALSLDNLSKPERAKYILYARYQYMASFGAQVFWYIRRGRQTALGLEKYLLDCFYERYLALPVANAANSY